MSRSSNDEGLVTIAKRNRHSGVGGEVLVGIGNAFLQDLQCEPSHGEYGRKSSFPTVDGVLDDLQIDGEHKEGVLDVRAIVE